MVNVLDRVGGKRLLYELVLILEEREPAGAIGRIASFLETLRDP